MYAVFSNKYYFRLVSWPLVYILIYFNHFNAYSFDKSSSTTTWPVSDHSRCNNNFFSSSSSLPFPSWMRTRTRRRTCCCCRPQRWRSICCCPSCSSCQRGGRRLRKRRLKKSLCSFYISNLGNVFVPLSAVP